ncbi:MAG: hypothetical protein ACWGQW_25800, partial [bacterium]
MKTFPAFLALFVTFSAFGFESNYGEMFFRGTPNNWGTTPMTLVADYTWEVGVTFGHSTHERFKFDAHGDWSENWGDNNNDGIGDQNGADIPAEDGRYYKVEFNDATKAYALKAQGRVYFSHQLYPSYVLAGLPIQVYKKQFNGGYDFYTSSVISYSGGTADPGSWYDFYLPVDRTFKVVLDAPRSNDRYQAETEFTVTPGMITQ